ncbi:MULTISPECIES: VOC family protein [unclassified Cupriavidus]|uniref:VOC family protein n=1 Tax=unclassified Cupriavidus TaxID=2640874 RepID=UPI000882E708|nr:VOC family protein [Cupriavidus sp. YR651]SDC27099.1 hypothetical protein SAMN05216345_1011171 [Cupriavidus sp. YR651]
MANALINWLEIPVTDMRRAVEFYEAVFESPLRRETMGDVDLAVFTHAESAGALVSGERYRSSAFYGPVPYLNAPQLDDVLARVSYAGGRTVHGPVQLPDNMGRYAHITDSEGNRIGLHEPVTH